MCEGDVHSTGHASLASEVQHTEASPVALLNPASLQQRELVFVLYDRQLDMMASSPRIPDILPIAPTLLSIPESYIERKSAWILARGVPWW